MRQKKPELSYRNEAGVALLLQLTIGVPILLLGGGIALLESLGSESWYEILISGFGRFPLTFIIGIPWAIIALLARRYRHSATVSVAALGLAAIFLLSLALSMRTQ